MVGLVGEPEIQDSFFLGLRLLQVQYLSYGDVFTIKSGISTFK